MKLEDLYTMIHDADRSQRLQRFQMRLFPPNGGGRISITTTQKIRFDEDINDIPQRAPVHYIKNRYFLKKVGARGWEMIGESDDWLNLWEIEYDVAKLPGTGTYVVKAIMYAEVDSGVFYSEDVVFFQVDE